MPAEWTSLPLKDICTKIGSGATPRGGDSVYLSDGEVSLIRSQNVYNNQFTKSGLVYLRNENAAELQNVIVEKADVLLNITGDSVARACQVPDDVLPARVNQHVAIIRPKPDIADSRFIRYNLVNPVMQAYMLQIASNGATRNALTKGMIESFQIPLPPLAEQKAIAHILGKLDDKIELNRKMNETLEAMARALFKSWFVDFDPVRKKKAAQATGLPAEIEALFPVEFEDSTLGEVPKGWRVGKLGDVSYLNPESWTKQNYPARIKYVDLANTKWGTIEEATALEKAEAPSRAQRVLRPGDTIVGTVRPGNGSYAYILEEGLTGSTGFAVLRPVAPQHSEFVYLAATSSEAIDRLAHLADGGAYPAVRPEVVQNLESVLPNENVFSAFSKHTRGILMSIQQRKFENTSLSKLRDTLLPKLISGELRVPLALRQAAGMDAERFVGGVV